MIDTNTHRVLAILAAWYVVGLMVLSSILLASSNASANTLSGTITDGQTKVYDVAVSSTLLPVTVYAYWTTLYDDNIDLVLKNPSGTIVETADSTTPMMEYFIYYAETTGTYKLEVIGTSITSSTSVSYTVSSTYHTISLSTSGGSTAGGFPWAIIIVVVVIIVAVIIVLLFFMMKKKQTQPMAPPTYGAQQPVQQYQYQQPQQQYAQPPPPQQYGSIQGQPMPQNCPYCGTKLDPSWFACPKCGARLKS